MLELKIAIVDAGPAGCTLAALLQRAGISCTIFEGESTRNFRSQGGSLDLHDNTGLAALRKAGLYDDFLKHARFDGEAIAIGDKYLRYYAKAGGGKPGKPSPGRPEMDRTKLRELLVDALPEGCIKWHHRLRRATAEEEGGTLHFDSGTQSGFDLIIRADGAWSKVRPLVHDVRPYHAGLVGIVMKIPDAANSQPDVHQLVNRGNWLKEASFDVHDEAQTKTALLKEYADWAPELKNTLEVAEGEPWSHNLYMLPIGHRWENKPGVTLIGDSAHLMTPFAGRLSHLFNAAKSLVDVALGEGVNVAMTDSSRLADAIIKARDIGPIEALHENVRAFEQDMFARATETQQLTYDLMNMMFFTPDAPDSVIAAYFSRFISDAPGLRYFMPIINVLVYAYFWWFQWWYPVNR